MSKMSADELREEIESRIAANQMANIINAERGSYEVLPTEYSKVLRQWLDEQMMSAEDRMLKNLARSLEA